MQRRAFSNPTYARGVHLRLSPCLCTAKAARALEVAGVEPAAARAMVTVFPLKEDVESVKEGVVALNTKMDNMTRLVIGLAILGNATVLIAAVFTASADSVAGRLLMH